MNEYYEILATVSELGTPAQLHFSNDIHGDMEEWTDIYGEITEDSFSAQIPYNGYYQVGVLFALGLIAGLFFGWVSSWGNSV